ncbi:MAG: hypothetical protein IJ343_16080 [Clostridia bacterium]|nr:hypothetical protein [Clostridia bacterium]
MINLSKQFSVDNMRFLVAALNKSEESITMLYNAAAMNFSFSGEQRAIYDGIKAQEEALTAYCNKERERLAAIIRTEGKSYGKDAALPGFPPYREFYEYNGERYMIINDEEEPSIRYIED